MELTADQKQLILDSEVSALAYGRGEDVVMFRLDLDEAGEDAAMQSLQARKLPFVGVFGLRDGVPVAKLDKVNPEAVYAGCFAGMAFVRIAADYLAHGMAANVFGELLNRRDSLLD